MSTLELGTAMTEQSVTATEKTKLKQHWAREAITLALQSRWEEAADINRSIIELFPNDRDAHNRLGKALTELGLYAEARQAYQMTLEIDPSNAIAQRNLARLSQLKEDRPRPMLTQRLDPSLFIEETGKTAVVQLYHTAPREILTRLTAGEQVSLKVKEQRLLVESRYDEYLGEVEPKLALRLIRLMGGGNIYQAAVATSAKDGTRIIIKEVFQDPSLAGHISFPSRAADSFRPYIKNSILKYELEEEEEEAAEWEEEEISLDDSKGIPDEE